MANAPIPISRIVRDPFVRKAFERAERGGDNQFAVPAKPKPVLPNGAVVRVGKTCERIPA